MAFSTPTRPALYKSSAPTSGAPAMARRATVALTNGTYCCTICSSKRLPLVTQRDARTPRERFSDFFTRARPLPFREHGSRFLIISLQRLWEAQTNADSQDGFPFY